MAGIVGLVVIKENPYRDSLGVGKQATPKTYPVEYHQPMGNTVEIGYSDFFQASLGAIPVLLLASLLNEKFTNQARTTKLGRIFHSLSVILSITAIFFSLVNLAPIAEIQEITVLKNSTVILNLFAVAICACSVGILGLLHLEEKPEQNEDNNNHLSDSASHSVDSSEDSQQQAIDTPKEDGREPQKKPKPKERAKDSDKEQ